VFEDEAAASARRAERSALRAAMEGRYVVALRGKCTFLQKANYVQQAGGLGLILVNIGEGLVRVSVGNLTSSHLTIPVVMVANASYAMTAGALERGLRLHGALVPTRDECVPPADPVQAAVEANRSANAAVEAASGAADVGAEDEEEGNEENDADDEDEDEELDGEDAIAAHLESLGMLPPDAHPEPAAPTPEPTAEPAAVPTPEPEEPHERISTASDWVPRLTETAELGFLPTRPVGSYTPAQRARMGQLFKAAAAAPMQAVAAVFSGPVFGQTGPLVVAEPFDACGQLIDPQAPPAPALVEEAAAAATATATPEVTAVEAGALNDTLLDAANATTNANTNATAPAVDLSLPRYRGAVVVAFRGRCSMVDKARHAQAAGALALIIVNNGAEPTRILAAAEAAGASSLFAPNYTRLFSSAPANASKGTLNAELSVGAIQAIADDHLAEKPVYIPTLMVSARSGMQFLWVEGGAVANMTGLVNVTLNYAAAKGSAWEDLFKLVGPNAKVNTTGQGHVVARGEGWPADRYQRLKLLSHLLRDHHPESPFGDAERWAVLLEGVARLGFSEELQSVESDGQWRVAEQKGGDQFDLDDASVTPLSSTSPSNLFLTTHLSGMSFARYSPEGMLACRTDSGAYYNVRLHDVDYASLSTINPGRRIAELMQTQACLEKLLMMNGATIGKYLRLLRRDTDADDWGKLSRALMHPFRMPEAKHPSVLSSYIELASLYEERLPMDDTKPVAEWIEAGMPRRDPAKAVQKSKRRVRTKRGTKKTDKAVKIRERFERDAAATPAVTPDATAAP
jgi:hypothetical protein